MAKFDFDALTAPQPAQKPDVKDAAPTMDFDAIIAPKPVEQVAPAPEPSMDFDALINEPPQAKTPDPAIAPMLARHGLKQSPPTPGSVKADSSPAGAAPPTNAATPGAVTGAGGVSIEQLPEGVLRNLPGAVKDFTSNDTYVSQQAGATVTQIMDFIPAKARGLRANAKMLTESIIGKDRAEALQTFGENIPVFGKLSKATDRMFKRSGEIKEAQAAQLAADSYNQGGVAGAVASTLTGTVEETLMNLQLFKAMKVGYGGKVAGMGRAAKSWNVVKGAFVRSGLMTMTTAHQSPADMAKSMAISLAYQSTPAVSGWINNNIGAVAVDIAQNLAISTTQMNTVIDTARAQAEAEGAPEKAGLYATLGLVQMYGSDVVFGAMTKTFKDVKTPRAARVQVAKADKIGTDVAAKEAANRDAIKAQVEKIAQAEATKPATPAPDATEAAVKALQDEIDKAAASTAADTTTDTAATTPLPPPPITETATPTKGAIPINEIKSQGEAAGVTDVTIPPKSNQTPMGAVEDSATTPLASTPTKSLSKMTVPELRAEAERRGLSSKGTGKGLRDRLKSSSSEDAIIIAAEKNFGKPLRTKQGKWRKGLKVLINDRGVTYKKPPKAQIIGIVDDTHVQVSFARPGNRLPSIEIIEISRLSESRAAESNRERGKQLAGLSKEERRTVTEQSRELDKLLYNSEPFTDIDDINKIEAKGFERDISVAKNQHIRAAREAAARAIGEPDTDMSDPRERARVLPMIRDYLDKYVAGERAADIIRDMKTSEDDMQMQGDDFEHNDLLYKDGEWHKVDTESGNVIRLEDGVTTELSKFDTVDVAGLLREGDPGYDKAVSEYAEQERTKPSTTEPLTLERQTPQDVAAERAKAETKARQAEMAALAEKPIKGRRVDTTGDLLDDSKAEAPLFATPTPRPQSKPLAAMTKSELRARADELGVTYNPRTPNETLRKLIKAKEGTTETKTAAATEQPRTRGLSIDAEGRKRNVAGFVQLPTETMTPRKPSKLKTWLKEHFLPSRGVGRDLYDRYVDMNAEVSAGAIESKQNVRRVNRIVDAAVKSSGADPLAVRQGMADVVNGRTTLESFVKANKLDANMPEVRLIEKMQADKLARQQLLAESTTGSAALKERISAFDYYQTRMYERFLLGDDFQVDPEDYRASVGIVADEIASKMGQIQRVGQKLAVKGSPSGQRTTVADVAQWLRTGDAGVLRGLAKSRQQQLIRLRNTYQRYADLVDTVAQGSDGNFILKADAVKVSDAAKDTVDYYLSKSDNAINQQSGVVNLRHRVLDQMWRNLYGEITDPAYTSGKSTEVQTKLLAQQAFFRDMHQDGRDNYWWERSAPGRVQLGKGGSYSDRLKYGPLAGKFVTQETYDLLHPTPRSNSIARKIGNTFFFKPQATMRLLKLFGPKTIVRNYVTAYTGFAMGSGDVALPGFHSNFAKAHGLIRRAAKGNEAAIAELRELANNNVFRTSTSSIIQDIDAATSTSPTTKTERALNAAGNVYAYIDFPTKYAAYRANIENGMSPKDAAKHVQDLYQNRDRVPKIVGQIGQGGLADYFGYTYDSVRIAANQIAHARAQAKQGNLAPMIGFVAGHGIQAVMVSAKATAYVGATWAAIHRLIRREKDVEESSQMEPTRIAALRDFQPEYYENAAQVAWEERKGGERTLYYTILSGQSAWPVEDWAIGVGQRARQEGAGVIPGAALKQIGERVGPGMYLDAVAKALMGERFGSKYNTKGVWDSFQIPNDSERGKIVLEAAGKYLADVYGGQPGQWASQTYDYMQTKEYRERAKEAGTYVNSTTPSEMAVGKAALVRTYRITKGDMERLTKARVKDWSLSVQSAKQAGNEPARLRGLQELVGIVNNAKSVSGDWFNDDEYAAILRDAGLNKEEAEAVVSGDANIVEPYSPKEYKTNLQRTREAGPKNPEKFKGAPKPPRI